LAGCSWDAFAAEAEAVIEAGEDSLTVRYLLALYASNGMLVSYLARLMRARREVGRRTTRLAAKVDPDLDRNLARAVLGVQKGEDGVSGQTALLEVLAESDRAEQMLPLLDRLRESEDPRVRSKMALLVGRAARAQSWLRLLREDPDPRVRANAIESLWNHGGAFAAICYDLGVKDENQRVAANSMVGLHRLGDPRSISLLAEMAQHPDQAFRTSAAWAMGETRDGRFVPLLWKLRRGDDPALASLAAAACEKILLAQAAATRTPVVIHPLGTHLAPDGSIESRAVVLDEKRAAVGLREIDWRPKLGNQTVWRYSVRQVDGLPRLAAAILFPHSGAGLQNPSDSHGSLFSEALREGFRSKRGNDALAVAFYAERRPHGGSAADAWRKPSTKAGGAADEFSSATHGTITLGIFTDRGHVGQPGQSAATCAADTPERLVQGADVQRALSLTADLRLAVRTAHPPPGSSLETGPIPAAMNALVCLRPFLGAKHLIIVADQLDTALWSDSEAQQVVSQAIASGISCHALCTQSLDPGIRTGLFATAIRTGGFNMLLEGLDALQSALPILASAFTRYYELRLQPEGIPDRLELEVASPERTGRAQVVIDRELRIGDPTPDIHWERESPTSIETAANRPGGGPSAEPTAAR
jgi:hypothetical protein